MLYSREGREEAFGCGDSQEETSRYEHRRERRWVQREEELISVDSIALILLRHVPNLDITKAQTIAIDITEYIVSRRG